MTTIREVAHLAGVSYATVSHVINSTRYVSDETRERVLAAMAELNYRPNALAQSLRSGKTNTIGLILPDSSNPFFAEIGCSIEAEAFSAGYSVILCNTELDRAREEIYIDVLAKKQVDGVIYLGAGDSNSPLDYLLAQGMPVVVIDREMDGVEADSVLVDNEQGGYLATRHLISLGHQRIACITGPYILTPDAYRLEGYRRAMLEAGLPIDEALVCRGDYHPESGQELASELLSQSPRPTAVFVCNDLMAFGVLRAAVKLGLRIPDELSIVGFDDIALVSYLNPALTTIVQPKQEVGARATRLLIERIGDKNRPYQQVHLPVSLVIRESSAAPAPINISNDGKLVASL